MGHVVVIGAGAIGSHLLPHLARSSRVSRITIVDPDSYEATNIAGQDIDAHGVGRPKAVVQLRRLRRIKPSLVLSAVVAAVEDLPLGALRSDLIVACLDSLRSRMTVNQAAWRLGVPWVDAGVRAAGLLARVTAFATGPDAPCLECGWDADDYATVEQTYPCAGGSGIARTGAPSALSGLAAAVQALECEKLLAGDAAHALVGREVLIDAQHHTHYLSERRRNPACRMPDHAGWRVDQFGGGPSDTTLGDVLAMGSTLRAAGERLTIRVAGQRFAATLTCDRCGGTHALMALERTLRLSRRACQRCAGMLQATGFGLRDALDAADVPEPLLDAPLAQLGMTTGDVFTLETPAVTVHYELRGEA